LLLARDLNTGYCGDTVEACTVFRLSPSVSLPCGHQQHCQGDLECIKHDYKALGASGKGQGHGVSSCVFLLAAEKREVLEDYWVNPLDQ